MQHAARTLGLYRLSVVTLAVMLLFVLGRESEAEVLASPLWGLPFFIVLAVIAEFRPLTLPRYGPVSLADAVCYAVMALYGPLATVTAAVAAGVSRFRRESRRQNVSQDFVAYSLSQAILSYGLGACLYAGFAGQQLGVLQALLLVVCVVATFSVQSLIVSVHQWLDQDRVGVWTTRINWQRLRLSLQAMLPLGLLMAETARIEPMALLLLLGPLAVTYHSICNYTETLREARAVIEHLAEAVERREPLTQGHSTRVAAYACDIARQLRLPEPMVLRVATAARLHDLGKISLGDEILSKAGRLEPQEWERVRRYPEVGAQVASCLSLAREEAEYIRYHQEWYNGQGYPYGIQGEEIPVGARILAVAKAYDALTSPRSYRRRPIPVARALNKLAQAKGTQFDPNVVEALLDVVAERPALAAVGG